MNDRDTFAAAALTGLLAGNEHNRDTDGADHAEVAYYIADAMLRERLRNGALSGCETVQPTLTDEEREAVSANGGTPGAASRDGSGTGDISEAQIDALECVVEDGRIVGMSVYGHLRSLLVRLRPEWEDEDDRQKPTSDERLAALEELSALDQELEEKHGLQGNPMIKARRNNESI